MSIENVETKILVEAIDDVVTGKDITANSDAERLFYIKVLIKQYMERRG